MKIVCFFLISLMTASVNAASIIYYESKKIGETQFYVINSKHVANYEYDESDREIEAHYVTGGSDSFKVATPDKAIAIIKRLYDESDNALIELERD